MPQGKKKGERRALRLNEHQVGGTGIQARDRYGISESKWYVLLRDPKFPQGRRLPTGGIIFDFRKLDAYFFGGGEKAA